MLESRLLPTSSNQEFCDVQIARERLQSGIKQLKRRAVDRIAAKERREARQHAATWKLLSSFNQRRVQPEVPPSAIYEHYRSISQVPGTPLTADEVVHSFVGPMTKEDSKLEDDVTTQEARDALDAANKNLAPGPDGLTARLVAKFLTIPLLVVFLGRFLTRCFRGAFVPSQWRTSENFILYKGVGAVADVSSFRAISLTQALAKVLPYPASILLSFTLLFIFIFSSFLRSFMPLLNHVPNFDQLEFVFTRLMIDCIFCKVYFETI